MGAEDRAISVVERIPAELRAFLERGEELDYDHEECEVGKVVLRRLPELELCYFKHGPGHGDVQVGSSYMIPGVDLLKGCHGDYDPEGLLVYLPEQRTFGTWDSSHDLMFEFVDAQTWETIRADPVNHLNAQWGEAFQSSVRTEPVKFRGTCWKCPGCPPLMSAEEFAAQVEAGGVEEVEV